MEYCEILAEKHGAKVDATKDEAHDAEPPLGLLRNGIDRVVGGAKRLQDQLGRQHHHRPRSEVHQHFEQKQHPPKSVYRFINGKDGEESNPMGQHTSDQSATVCVTTSAGPSPGQRGHGQIAGKSKPTTQHAMARATGRDPNHRDVVDDREGEARGACRVRFMAVYRWSHGRLCAEDEERQLDRV